MAAANFPIQDQDLTSPSLAIGRSGLPDEDRKALVERVANSEAFQKSIRLPALLRYLATCTIAGDRAGMTEQAIGRAVFAKAADFHPTEDSSVRVYVRQLRLRLYEYFQSAGQDERIIIEIPKGGYALAFQARHAPATVPQVVLPVLFPSVPTAEPEPLPRLRQWTFWILPALLAFVAIVGWGKWFTSASLSTPPWPLNQVIEPQRSTTVVLADASYALRLLGDRQISLDEYADHKYTNGLIPENASRGELSLFHYLQDAQLTSMTDARAASTVTLLAGSLHDKLIFRSAKEVNGDTMLTGNFIIVGAKSSNPWVELYEPRMNFRLVENGIHGSRYIENRNPGPGEEPFYAVHESTGHSGEDFATISLLPGLSDLGTTLLVQGIRREGTEAAIQFLSVGSRRGMLQERLRATNGGRLPKYFEVLIRSHAVAGSATSIDCIAVRPLR